MKLPTVSLTMMPYVRALKIISWIVVGIFTTLFCLLFTIPGNQAIVWGVNKLVPGVTISDLQARLYDNQAFNLDIDTPTLQLNASGVKLDLTWWQCEGLCIALAIDEVNGALRQADTSTADTNSTAEAGSEVVPENDETPNEAEQQSSFMARWPIAFDVQITALSFWQAEQQSVAKALKLSGIWRHSALELEQVSLDTLQHTSVSKDTSAEPRKAIVLPAISPEALFPLPLHASLKSLRINDVSLISQTDGSSQQVSTPSSNEPLNISNLALSAEVTANQIAISVLELSLMQYQSSATLLIQPNQVEAALNIAGNGQQLNAKLAGPWSNLALDLASQAPWPVKVAGTVNVSEADWPITLDAEFAQLPAYNLGEEHGSIELVQAKLGLHGRLSDFQLRASAQGQSSQYGPVTLSTELSGSQAALKVKTLKLQSELGHLQASSAVTLAPDLALDAELNWQGVQLQKLLGYPSLLAGNVQFSFKQSTTGWLAKVDNLESSGTLNQFPLTLKLQGEVDDQLLAKVAKAELQYGSSFVELSGRIQQQLQLAGKWQLDLDQKSGFGVIAKGNGTLQVSGKRTAPELKLDAAIAMLDVADVKLQDASAKIDYQHTQVGKVNADIHVAELQVAKQQLKALSAQVKGSVAKHTLSVKGEGDDFHFAFGALGGIVKQAWQGEVTQLQGVLAGLSLQQTSAAKLRVAGNGEFKLDELCIKSPLSQLCSSVSLNAAQQGQVKVALANLDWQEFWPVMPRQMRLAGAANGELDASFGPQGIQTLAGSFNADNSLVILEQEGLISTLDLGDISANVTAKGSHLQVSLKNAESQLSTFALQLETQLGQATPPIKGELSLAKLDLAQLDSLVAQALNRSLDLRGNVQGQVSFKGALARPELHGHLAVEQLFASNEKSPLQLTDSNLNMSFQGQTLEVNGQLNDHQAGSLALEGKVAWQQEWWMDLRLSGQDLLLTPQTGVEFKVNSDISVSLEQQMAKVKGKLAVPYGRIAIKSLPENAVSISADQIFVDNAEETPESLPFRYDVQLQVDVLDNVRIDSFGLKSYITGGIALSKQNDTPVVGSGELSLVDGTFKAFGQDLQIKTGQIGFSGALDKPYLHVNAIRNPATTANGVIAGLQLTGPASAPNFTVYSEPAMDQSHALSYLLNGQPLGEGESDKNVLLTNLILSQGLGRGEGVLQKVGKGIGLSDVNVGTKGAGEGTQVEVSGYLTPSVQVKYSVGVFDSLSEIAIRYQIFSKLYVEITSGLYDSIDLLYRFDWGQ
ncbi:translocation/assembly module TamB domain-containing protein [Pseudoalteromonas fenneropenaei]|uniref:Translocation/assembly module TamB domain-containing protein n=1 Tax=Pseudoalteromonas fenneropenaei TaxID=1737459 RepID=A0ABV7CHY3_9GAMM